MNINTTLLALATITTGLSAGLLFGYQVSVIPAFKTLSDADYIAAMQAINSAIQNPVFLLIFFGAAIFLLGAVYLHRSTPGSPQFQLLVAATVLYIIGTLGITMGVNVPLNDTLAAFALHSSTPAQMAMARSAFEVSWNTWHLIRTLASIGSLMLISAACLAPSPAMLPLRANRSEKPMGKVARVQE